MINCVYLCVYVRTCVYVNTSGPHNCAHTLRCVLLQGGTYIVSLLSWIVTAWSSREQRGAGSASHFGCATVLNLLSAHSPDRQLVNRGRVRPCVCAHGRELINTGAVCKIIKIKLSQQVASQCQDPSLSPARGALLWAVKQTGGSGNRGPRCSTHQHETLVCP